MKLCKSTRANERRAGNKRHWAMGTALLVGAFLFGLAPLPSSASAQSGVHVISGDSKKADKEAKKAERAAARAAKKKSKQKGDDDGSLAKAKTGKGGSKSGSGVDLGDDDPLEGL